MRSYLSLSLLETKRPLVFDVFWLKWPQPMPQIQNTSDDDSDGDADGEEQAVSWPSDDQDQHHGDSYDETGSSSPGEARFGVSWLHKAPCPYFIHEPSCGSVAVAIGGVSNREAGRESECSMDANRRGMIVSSGEAKTGEDARLYGRIVRPAAHLIGVL
jgi:hypothetical protein